MASFPSKLYLVSTFLNAHSAVHTALLHLVHHPDSYLEQGTEVGLASERSSPRCWENNHLPI